MAESHFVGMALPEDASQPSLPAGRQILPAWHAVRAERVLDQLASSLDGLSAEQARARLGRDGPNRLPEKAPIGAVRRFLEQLHDPMIYALLATALVTAVLRQWVDSAVIVAVILINACVGFVQQSRAERAIAGLKKLLSPTAEVRRDGRMRSVPVGELVVGDVVSVQGGDKVPADLRLLESYAVRCEEAALTGESLPQDKHSSPLDEAAPLAERSNMLFAGTLVTAGTGLAVVTSVAGATELGRVAAMLEDVQEVQTPLARRLERFARFVMVSIGFGCIGVFLAGVFVGRDATEMLMASVALAVSAIPEGLPAIVTIALAIGVSRMAARNAVVRKLPAVEALGGATVICSDKTGTLTRNEMMAVSVYTAAGRLRVSGDGYAPEGELLGDDGRALEFEAHAALRPLIVAAALCNRAHLVKSGDTWEVQGDPTEGALLALAARAGQDAETLRRDWQREGELPFDSAIKWMATLERGPDHQRRVFIKGAPERVLALCDCEADGASLDRDEWRARSEALASAGQRVLAFAVRDWPDGHGTLAHDSLGNGVRWLGLVGMTDPPRQEAIESVRRCQQAGIRVKMMTGDHLATARCIAEHLGIQATRVLSGKDVDELQGEALEKAIGEVDVFARVTPAHKLLFVQSLQRQGAIVAMTGDGVNDAPALKQADIGVAMGITGTEVAKDAADFVLLDDNFATIERAVEEGRTVFENVKKTILFILPTNGGECATLIAALLSGTVLPILPLHVLWINLVTTVALAITLAFDPTEPGTMQRPPRAPDAPIVDRVLMLRVASVSLWMALLTFGLFRYERSLGSSLPVARAVAVNAVVFFEVFYLFNTRSVKDSALRLQTLTGNPWVLLGVLGVVLLQWALTYWKPLSDLFQLGAMGLDAWLRVLMSAGLLFFAVELQKLLERRFLKA